MTSMLAMASIEVMDALFGFVARNDAECCKREILGRSWRRDWAMRIFRAFFPIGQKLPGGQFFCGLDAVGNQTEFTSPPGHAMWIFERKNDFLEHRKKGQNFA